MHRWKRSQLENRVFKNEIGIQPLNIKQNLIIQQKFNSEICLYTRESYSRKFTCNNAYLKISRAFMRYYTNSELPRAITRNNALRSAKA